VTTAAPTRAVAAIGASVACTVAAVLPSFLLGGLASLVRADLDFDEAALGLAVSCFYGASALTAIPGGRAAEKLGARRSLALGLCVAVAALGGIAALATSWGWLAAGMALGGVSNGVVQPAAALALARGVRPGRLGIAFGVKQSAVPVATVLAGLAVPAIGLTIGWRWAFGLGAVGAIALLAVLPPDERTPDEPTPEKEGGSHAVGVGRHARVTRAQLPGLAVMALASCGGAIASNSMGAFYVESAVAGGEDLALAGLLLSLGSACGIAVRLLGGWLCDRRMATPLRLAGLMVLSGTVGYLLFAYVGGTPALVVATLIAYAGGWGWPGLLQLAAVQDHLGAPAAASGIVHAGALTGGLVGPIAFGWVVSTVGYGPAWTGIAVVAAAAGTLLLTQRRPAATGEEPAR
jgi:predicted MFS family arabinose efflux permease